MKFNALYFTEYKDMYNLYNLITKINKNYKLFYNQKDKVFVITNTANNNQICLIFNSFSENIIKSLQFSRVENSQYLYKYIENNNDIIQTKNTNTLINETTGKIKDLIHYFKRANSLNKYDISKYIGG